MNALARLIETECATITRAGADLSSAIEKTMMALCEVSFAASETSESAARAADGVSELCSVHGAISARADAAMAFTRQSVERAEQVKETFEALSSGLRKIEGVSARIQLISRQTHLVAMNASIESARLGAEGRVFKIIADEVKHLAEQAAEMSKWIVKEIASVDELALGSRAALDTVIKDVSLIDVETAGIVESLGVQSSVTESLAEHARQSVDQMNKVSNHILEIQSNISDAGAAHALLTTSVDALLERNGE